MYIYAEPNLFLHLFLKFLQSLKALRIGCWFCSICISDLFFFKLLSVGLFSLKAFAVGFCLIISALISALHVLRLILSGSLRLGFLFIIYLASHFHYVLCYLLLQGLILHLTISSFSGLFSMGLCGRNLVLFIFSIVSDISRSLYRFFFIGFCCQSVLLIDSILVSDIR